MHNDAIRYAIWQTDTALILIGVNTSAYAVPLTLDMARLAGQPIAAARRMFDEGAVRLTDGILHERFPGYERRVIVLMREPVMTQE